MAGVVLGGEMLERRRTSGKVGGEDPLGTFDMDGRDLALWNSLPPRAKRHVLIRFGKVSNNIGRHPEAAKAFQEVVDLGLDETIDERLGTIREALNSFRQMLEKASLVGQPSFGDAPVLAQMRGLLKTAADTLKLGDIRDAGDSHNGLVPGLAMFPETLEYLERSSAEPLKRHRHYIDEMVSVQKATGWNQFSPYVALALARRHLDTAYEGLSAALSQLHDKPASDMDIDACARSVAKKMKAPDLKRDPGRIELAVHLGMWGQYWWAMAEAQPKRYHRERALPFFQAARTILADVGHRRCFRDLDSFLSFYPSDSVSKRTGVPAQLRRFGPPEFTTASFFPLSPP